jgi:Uma2 family endonuclease
MTDRATTDPTQALLDSPTLPRHVERLRRVLDDEAARRARFVDEIQPHEKGEFINGEVVMSSPALRKHNLVSARLSTLLDAYVRAHDLGEVAVEKAMVSLTRNDYEPDVAFFGRNTAAELTGDTLRYPAPDLAVEILSPSTEARDRGIKFEDYAAHGVTEYWIVDAEAETVEQFVLGEGEAYALRMKSATGDLVSVAVEGFAVPVRALFDDAANVEALRALLA